jgi:hypothetical protein
MATKLARRGKNDLDGWQERRVIALVTKPFDVADFPNSEERIFAYSMERFLLYRHD